MGHEHASSAGSNKRYISIPPDPEAVSWKGPVVSRGWLVGRSPLLHPVASIHLLLKWIRLKRELNRAPGLLSFEYRLRFDAYLFGMYVCWRSKEDEMEFYRTSSHRDIAEWAMKARLIPALKLEHLALDANQRLIALGGFYACEREEVMPSNDFLFPPASSSR